ncbi:CaiB/BaiF CoA-transferase family protein [Sphingobium sp. DC-2]|uniref:CaiB/BaiF CoA transferase family protein n=1 Tax=Sphingobium sp. DC-2 TaxID=1303256 RepID=UPI0004C3E977|nr:CaiB/BaiF CoA-transferase family protein [Sphingobium sp. DC-2]
MPDSLKGILVISLEQAVAAPLCTSRLAEAGARVIKLERAEGDFARGYDHAVHGESAYFVWLNRGKESVRVDVKDPADRHLIEKMLARADIFVQNLAPGAAARLGLGSSELRARYPRLITCDITGYGDHGPAAGMKAYDFLIQCEAGLASITGNEAGAARVGVSVADIACGMNAHAAILQALIERERSGTGRGVAVSLFDSLADWMAVPLLHHDYAGKAPGRVGLRHPSIAPYGAFRAGDGVELVISIQNEREWAKFCALVLEHPDLARDPRFASNSLRCENRGALEQHISALFASLPAETIITRFEAAGTAWARLNGVDGLSRHSQLRRVEGQTPSGPVSLPAPPIRWNDERPVTRSVPALGEHDETVRAEFR